jgi:hypothetical protein
MLRSQARCAFAGLLPLIVMGGCQRDRISHIAAAKTPPAHPRSNPHRPNSSPTLLTGTVGGVVRCTKVRGARRNDIGERRTNTAKWPDRRSPAISQMSFARSLCGTLPWPMTCYNGRINAEAGSTLSRPWGCSGPDRGGELFDPGHCGESQTRLASRHKAGGSRLSLQL